MFLHPNVVTLVQYEGMSAENCQYDQIICFTPSKMREKGARVEAAVLASLQGCASVWELIEESIWLAENLAA